MYNEADFIGCMSQGNIDYIKRHNPKVVVEKLHELKNFQKLYIGFHSDPMLFLKKYELLGKYLNFNMIFSYIYSKTNLNVVLGNNVFFSR